MKVILFNLIFLRYYIIFPHLSELTIKYNSNMLCDIVNPMFMSTEAIENRMSYIIDIGSIFYSSEMSVRLTYISLK